MIYDNWFNNTQYRIMDGLNKYNDIKQQNLYNFIEYINGIYLHNNESYIPKLIIINIHTLKFKEYPKYYRCIIPLVDIITDIRIEFENYEDVFNHDYVYEFNNYKNKETLMISGYTLRMINNIFNIYSFPLFVDCIKRFLSGNCIITLKIIKHSQTISRLKNINIEYFPLYNRHMLLHTPFDNTVLYYNDFHVFNFRESSYSFKDINMVNLIYILIGCYDKHKQLVKKIQNITCVADNIQFLYLVHSDMYLRNNCCCIKNTFSNIQLCDLIMDCIIDDCVYDVHVSCVYYTQLQYSWGKVSL